MKVHLVKELYVEAAHRNPYGGAAQRRLHGHSYRVSILACGTPNAEIGWVVDFAELKQAIGPVAALLDHALLNELPGLERDTRLPALCDWTEAHISPRPAWLEGIRVSIHGDLAFRARRIGADSLEQLPERLGFTFEAAQSLPQLPAGHPCRRIHGHSYRIEAGADDLVALEPVLAALYDRLDHRYLNEVPGLESATVERMCEYIWAWIRDRGIHPAAVVVQETPSSRCAYFGE